MKTEQLHLYLGLTRAELKRRLDLGLIDKEILNFQLDEYEHELKLEALCENWIEANSGAQVDKMSDLE